VWRRLLNKNQALGLEKLYTGNYDYGKKQRTKIKAKVY